MSDNAPLVLLDGADTPVTHTFDPRSVTGNTANWTNYAQSMATARETVTLTVDESQKAVRKVLVKAVLPRVANVAGVDTVVDFETWQISCLSPYGAPSSLKSANRVMIANLILNELIGEAIDEGKMVW